MQVADRVERSDVGGVRPERLIDRRPSGRVPSRAPVHLRQHQIDVAARRIERRGPPQLRLGVAVEIGRASCREKWRSRWAAKQREKGESKEEREDTTTR